MSEIDTRTPTLHDTTAQRSPEGQNRRFSSFFIADILSEPSDSEVNSRPAEESSKEGETIEDESFQEQAKGKNFKDRVKEERNSEQNNVACSSSCASKQATPREEDSFSNMKSRSPFLAEQREVLEKVFQESKYISSSKRKQLALELGLTERQIKTWFQNRRTKFRKIRGNDGLRRQGTWNAEHGGVARVLSNIDEGINGLSKDWVLTLYSLLSKR